MKKVRSWSEKLTLLTALGLAASAGTALAADQAPVKAETCYECHDTVKSLHMGSKHAGVNCVACHSGLDAHLKDQSPATRPGTDISWEACGACHQDQHTSFNETSYLRPARDEKSQLTNRAPNPFWDKLMAGHGFTKEHALTRSHTWMLVDHLVVDRAYGGRFQPKNGWQYVAEPGGKKAGDYIIDNAPDSNEQKAFIPQSAAAANPVCLQCKTQDTILDWAYMGDPDKGAKWSRSSNVVDLARDVNHGLNCFMCHDPHSARPRIVRDGLIEALTRPEGDTLWHKDPNRTKITVMEMGERGFTRKIALLEKYDSRLQCGQCHVEYNCNPGTDTKTGEKVTMADRRTNHFPYKDVFGLYDHYVNQINFLDFKHAKTGGLLWKGQHPESESFYNSKHAEAGVQCTDCHFQKRTDASGKEYTSHFAVTPKVMIKDACLKCHSEWTEEQAKYAIDSVKAFIRGKLRKSEFWLSALIDKIVEAKKAGVSEDVIKQAQDQHLRAHILWEYWTAENSDGFHNPEMARESLTKSIDESQKGIKLIEEAMAPPVAKK
ncbi:MAG: ammonia-forming cytochrome c nitrite reductase subunit c552 [Proteobacteria bacterium]|nr:ammonia-forming cytochrome c nitrite reductase subunit c552 [Desulfobulbaceae bacterium]MBU4153832.1 ammonia-forming cytochrome c nitrite reductase subunit c552 [Pseudomonadota bacterium]